MKQKTLIIGTLLLFLLLFVVASIVVNPSTNPKNLSVQNAEQQATQKIFSESWVPFTNTQHNFTISHPVSLAVLAGSEVLVPEADSSVYVENGLRSIFSIEYLYPTDQEINKQINADTKAGRVAGNAEWKEYIRNRDDQFSEFKKYRDLSLLQFANLVSQALVIGTTSPTNTIQPLQMMTVDGLPAYQFIQKWREPSSNDPIFSDESIPLRIQGGPHSLGGKHIFVLLEDKKGQKLIIRYLAENPISVRVFESLRFVE
ncbi:MAG: hypothetical protein WCT02_00140 [Candidatus Paceibacterota bacterium]|jgi:hypothetical protein